MAIVIYVMCHCSECHKRALHAECHYANTADITTANLVYDWLMSIAYTMMFKFATF